jgi:multiple antibiotic resistance protein
MPESLTHAFVSFGSVFAIVDPFAAVPIFVALVGERSAEERKRVALRAAITCFVVLTVFAAAGSFVLSFFSISLPAFKIAGGIILFLVGMEMVRASPSGTRSTREEQSEAAHKEDVAVIPLGLPLLSGPGAMATVMVLAGHAGSTPNRVAVFAAIFAVCAVTLLILRSAGLLARALGKTGINVIGRIMGLILTAYAVQFVIDGAREALHLAASSAGASSI